MERGRSGTGAYSLLALGCIFFGAGVGISSILIGAYLETPTALAAISMIIKGIHVLWMTGCALLGVFMALVAIPMIIVGAVKHLRARTVRIDTTIFSTALQLITRESRSLKSREQFCLSCNLVFPADSIFCASCGARIERRA